MQESKYLLENYQALGTVWYIEFFDNLDQNKIEEIQKYIISEINSFQKKFSRFEADSVLNQLNREGSTLYEEDLLKMLEIGEVWRLDTDGVFDVAVKERLESIGYGSLDKSTRPSAAHLGARLIHENDKISWTYDKKIDLGGIGKGYLIDKIAQTLLNKFDIKYFIINGGGDIYVTSDNGKAIELLLEHPTNKDLYIGKVKLLNQSLCCSSSFKRVWKKDGNKYNHFIDTKNNKVIEAASYVISENATTADILATVILILGDNISETERLVEKSQSEYLVMSQSGSVYASSVFKIAVQQV